MKRTIVHIDEEKCNGCGVCVPNCHEGALQMIDGKARLISDLMCDGLGACIGHCPEGAITMEEREARPYDEIAVMKEMVNKGKNTVIAHLTHLKEHNEIDYFKQGVHFLRDNSADIDFSIDEVIIGVNNAGKHEPAHHHGGGGCPGSQSHSFSGAGAGGFTMAGTATPQPSSLTHWPVQMHLINPAAGHFRGADFVLAADCVAFSVGDFHSKFLKGKTLGIACPKLDQGTGIYIEKIKTLIDDAKINTLTLMIMEVPCCGGLVQIAKMALQQAQRNIPVKMIKVSVQGEILMDEWV